MLTNPPYGKKTRLLKEDAQHFELGHTWVRRDGAWRKGKPKETSLYTVFVERAFDILKDGGRLAIVLPETVFHAPSLARLRHYIADKGAVRAVISLPHNTFRPHCNAKTCLLVVEKGAEPSDPVIMATPEEMGHDHQGKSIYRAGTDEPWDDLPLVLQEFDQPSRSENTFVFTAPWDIIQQSDCWMPQYHAFLQKPPRAPRGQFWVTLGELVDEEAIAAWDGHGSPSSAEKGAGEIPYIRVSDIVNWELYRNPTTGISQSTFDRMTANGERVEAGDVIFVRRGSYRIGTVAMAAPRDQQVMLTRELLTFRVQENTYGITPYYLLALLSSQDVQEQIENLVFVDTTLPTMGERWRELRLPIHRDRQHINAISHATKLTVMKKWRAQDEIQELRNQFGGLVT